jgi:formylglycine-generating enzyme
MVRGYTRVRRVCAAAIAVGALVACTRFDAATDVPALDGGADAAGGDADSAALPVDAGTPPRCSTNCPGDAGPCGRRDDGGTSSFCIDATEVTEADYAQFVAQKIDVEVDAGLPCGTIKVRAPSASRGRGNLPVTGVSFCDARAYCAWAGKRLCGHIQGGPLRANQYVPAESQWYHACTNGTPDSVVLRGSCALDGSAPVEAGTSCEGALPGLFDMVGNVWEWVDLPQYDKGDSGAPYGTFVGGSHTSKSSAYNCGSVSALADLNYRTADVGFRCCSP